MRNKIFAMTMPSVIIPSEVNESSDGAICRAYGAIAGLARPMGQADRITHIEARFNVYGG
jgi:hypothetical protein